ncbi:MULTISPECIES: hypothetical protein [unclassified Pseudonocardia]|nr:MULTISPECIES: hypothetical protein [unclassified Pseudonocardia]
MAAAEVSGRRLLAGILVDLPYGSYHVVAALASARTAPVAPAPFLEHGSG